MARDARAGRTVLGALFGAALLVGAGFGLGLVVGASFEEPAILMGYFAGASQEVAAPDPAPPEAVAAAPTEPPGVEPSEPGTGPPLGVRAGEIPAIPPSGATEPPAAEPEPAPPPPKRTPAVAAAPPAAAAFAVQVGAFRERAPADDLTRRLSRSGFRAYVVGGTPGDGRWRVRVGPVASRRDADRLATRLKREQRLPTWVVADGG